MRMSIGGRILLGVVLVQLASAGVILGFFFYSVGSDLDELAARGAEEAVLRSIEETEGYFLPAETVVEATRRLVAGEVLGRDRPDQLERYLFEQLRLREQLAGLYVGYPDGGFVHVMRSGEAGAGGTRSKLILEGPAGREVRLTWRGPDHVPVRTARDPEDAYDPRSRAWYRAAVERRGLVWTEPYVFFSSRAPGITAAAAVTGADGRVEAVVGADMEMSEVSGFLRQVGLGLGGAAFIVTPGGEVVAHSSVDLILPAGGTEGEGLRFRRVAELEGLAGSIGERILARYAEQAGASEATVWQEQLDGTSHFIAIGRMASVDWPWLAIAVVPERSLLEAARGSNLILIVVVFLASALAIAAGYALSQSIGKPLATLHRNAKLARNGNAAVMDEIASGHREIDETADALLELARRRGPAGTGQGARASGATQMDGNHPFGSHH